MADCREITKANVTTQGTTTSASHEQDNQRGKLAILTPLDNDFIFLMARAYQMFAEGYRKSVRLFHDFNTALVWLTDDNALENKSLTSLINIA